MLETATHVKALFTKLDQGGFFYRYRVSEEDNSDQLEALFFAHPQSIQDFKNNFDVLMLDNTFKTNEYNIPLCNIVGTTGMNTTIQLGLAFIPKQDEKAFFWIFMQVQDLFT